MTAWPFRRPTDTPLRPLASDAVDAVQDLLRRDLDDGVFAVEQQGTRGRALIFGGELLVPAGEALSHIETRFRRHGYTPFITRDRGRTWIQALPLRTVTERSRPAVNLLLFCLTLLSTLLAGAMGEGAIPWLTFDPLREPFRLLDGLPFAVSLLAILGTHEFGHYFTARFHGASVSLPYFIPAPPPLFLFGTLGAVIRMRSPARDRNSLLDIAAAGPLAGLVVALPAVWFGLAWSEARPIPDAGVLMLGDSALMRLFVYLLFGPLPEGTDVVLHPVALAGWAGLFVTALNLFPVGQLDGGRIAYALFGAHHRKVSIGTFFALVGLGLLTGAANWFVFAGLLALLIGFHHAPPLDDVSPLTPGRYALGVACFVLLILLIPPVPIQLS